MTFRYSSVGNVEYIEGCAVQSIELGGIFTLLRRGSLQFPKENGRAPISRSQGPRLTVLNLC